MEPVESVGNTAEYKGKGRAEATDGARRESPPSRTAVGSDLPSRSPTDVAEGAGDVGRGAHRQASSSYNSVDELLRRISRDVSGRRGRESGDVYDRKSSASTRHHRQAERNERGHDDPSIDGGTRRGGDTYTGSAEIYSQRRTRRPRSERFGDVDKGAYGMSRQHRDREAGQHNAAPVDGSSAVIAGSSSRWHGAGGGEGHAGSPAAAPSAAEINPFTEGMWEDASCRQVLQAMFFAADSAIPAGSTEEYKELEG